MTHHLTGAATTGRTWALATAPAGRSRSTP